MTLTALQPSARQWDRSRSRPQMLFRRWDLRLAGGAPGLAITVSLPGVHRLVVADTVRSERGDPVRRGDVIERSLVRDPAQVAAALVGDDGQQRLCTGVVIVDLVDDVTDDADGDSDAEGRSDIHVCDSPPAILLRPGEKARLVPDLAQDVGSTMTVRAGDVLLVCSAALLEQPPAVLAGLRRSSDLMDRRADVEQVRQALAAATFRGAAATITRNTVHQQYRRHWHGRGEVPDVTVS